MNIKTVSFAAGKAFVNLYQYDKGQKFAFTDASLNGHELQFDDGSVKVINDNTADVPDAFLEASGDRMAWIQIIGEDSETTVLKIFMHIQTRRKKNDYVEPEDEPTFREQLQNIMKATKTSAASAATAAEQAKETADSIRRDADAGRFNGRDGERGPQGEQGERGPEGQRGPAGSDASVTAENIQNALGYVPADDEDIPSLEEYVKNTDYATNAKSGVVKVNTSRGVETVNGILRAIPFSSSDYNSRDNYTFISKGTLDNVNAARNVTMTQDEYDALAVKDPLATYYIVEEE